MQLISEYPWWFLLFCLATGALFTWLLYGRKPYVFEEGEHPAWRYGLAALRFSSVTLIAVLLLSMLWKRTDTVTEKPLIVFLQDNSNSLQLSFGSFAPDKYHEQAGQLQQLLKEEYDVAVYNFSGTLQPQQGKPDFSGQETNISAAIEEVFEREGARNIGALILASDGIFNQGNSPQYTRNALNVPIYTIALGDTSVQKDLLLQQVRYPELVYLGDDFMLDISVSANNLNGTSTTLEVLDAAGNILLSKNIAVASERFSTQVQVPLTAAKAGMMSFSVRLKAVKGELSLANNQEMVYVEVLDGRKKVLVLFDAPHPDIKAIRAALSQQKSYEVTQADIKTFKADINAYDLVVLHGLPAAGAASGLALLQSLNQRDMPVLWVLTGATQLPVFNNLQRALQISGTAQSGNEVYAVHRPEFAKFILTAETVKQISELPPLLSPFGKYAPSADADILFYQQLGNVKTTQPLVLLQQSGNKKTAVIAGEGLWRWRLHEFAQTKQTAATDELLQKTVQYLTVQTDKRRFRVNAVKNVFRSNVPVQLDAMLYNESYVPVNESDVTVRIQGEQGKAYDYTFDKTGNAYTLNAGILPPGNYQVSAQTTYKGRKETAACAFYVRDVTLESLQTRANHQLLNTLSASSGAAMYGPQDMLKIVEDLRKNENITAVLHETFTTQPLIDEKWLFIIILLLLSIEWFIRKYYGNV